MPFRNWPEGEPPDLLGISPKNPRIVAATTPPRIVGAVALPHSCDQREHRGSCGQHPRPRTSKRSRPPACGEVEPAAFQPSVVRPLHRGVITTLGCSPTSSGCDSLRYPGGMLRTLAYVAYQSAAFNRK